MDALGLDLKTTVRQLQRDTVVAIPAEGVWGFSCTIESEKAVQTICNIKRRDLTKGFIVGFSDPRQIAGFLAILPRQMQRTIESSQSKPTTWIVPHCNYFADWLSGSRSTIALRWLHSCGLYDVCQSADCALLTTSANISNQPVTISQSTLRQQFPQQYYYDIDPLLNGKSSTIIDVETQRVLRA